MRRPRTAAGQPAGETIHGVRLLAVDPDLGGTLAADQLRQAREHAIFPCAELEAGPLAMQQLHQAPGVHEQLHGFLVLDGSLMLDIRISGRTCTRLIGPRELILLDSTPTESIPVEWEWSVLSPARLALLDGRLHVVARRWPAFMAAILQRAAQQARTAFLQQAISQLPRVEERLLALLWSIADRQGVVRPDGVWVKLSATHHTLARMVGAQRPTVSLGLSRLAAGGLLCQKDDGWLIAHDSLDVLGDPTIAANLRRSLNDAITGVPEPQVALN